MVSATCLFNAANSKGLPFFQSYITHKGTISLDAFSPSSTFSSGNTLSNKSNRDCCMGSGSGSLKAPRVDSTSAPVLLVGTASVNPFICQKFQDTIHAACSSSSCMAPDPQRSRRCSANVSNTLMRAMSKLSPWYSKPYVARSASSARRTHSLRVLVLSVTTRSLRSRKPTRSRTGNPSPVTVS